MASAPLPPPSGSLALSPVSRGPFQEREREERAKWTRLNGHLHSVRMKVKGKLNTNIWGMHMQACLVAPLSSSLALSGK